MDTLPPEVLLFPITSFPYMLNTKPELQECFLLDFVVRPGWIVYNPNAVTVLSRNQMFQPVYELAPIWNPEKQVFKMKCSDDLQELKDMLAKPIVFCTTRRQECEAMINGFDTDFVLVLDPSDPKIATQIKKIVDRVEQRLASGQKFCLKIDFAGLLDELTKHEFKYMVYWLNSEFHITNHCRPNQFLQLNIWYLWCAMLPFFLLASLPYRVARKTFSHDEEIHLKVRLRLDFCPDTVLVLHFYTAHKRPMPARYLTEGKLYIERDCDVSELRSLAYFKSPNEELKQSKRRRLNAKKIMPKFIDILESTKLGIKKKLF